LTTIVKVCIKLGMLEVRRTAEFIAWLQHLRDVQARARIAKRIDRIAQGNFGDAKVIGGGVHELRFTFGPGYRVYIYEARRRGGDPVMRRRQGIAGAGYRTGQGIGRGGLTMTIETKPWDAADVLQTPADIAAYLDAYLEDGTPEELLGALNTIARSRGMSALARETGISREALYRAFSDNGNPTLDTLLRVMKALGVRLAVAA